MELINGYWKYKGTTEHNNHIWRKLVNIYNGNEVLLTDRQYKSVKEGKDTISKIVTRRIKENAWWITNNVKKTYAQNVRKYVRKETY